VLNRLCPVRLDFPEKQAVFASSDRPNRKGESRRLVVNHQFSGRSHQEVADVHWPVTHVLKPAPTEVLDELPGLVTDCETGKGWAVEIAQIEFGGEIFPEHFVPHS
jgi:hypothetical protein